jgi:hypothetical protein
VDIVVNGNIEHNDRELRPPLVLQSGQAVPPIDQYEAPVQFNDREGWQLVDHLFERPDEVGIDAAHARLDGRVDGYQNVVWIWVKVNQSSIKARIDAD